MTLEKNTKNKIDEIYDRLFDPEDGLYARIRDVQDKVEELSHKVQLSNQQTERDINDLNTWRQSLRQNTKWIIATIIAAAAAAAKFLFE